MKLIELTSAQQFRKVIQGMNRIGISGLLDFEYNFQPVKGAVGGFGSIMSHPRLSYVVKLFDSDDVGYLQFVKLAKTHSNPHFPRIVGQPMKLSKDTMGVRVERLFKWPVGQFEAIEYLLHQARRDPNWRTHLDSNEEAAEFLQQWPHFAEAIDLLNASAMEANSDVEFDWHDGNIMQRADGTPVIVDPFTPGY